LIKEKTLGIRTLMMTSKELIPKDRWLKLAKEYRYWANKNTWCPFYKDKKEIT